MYAAKEDQTRKRKELTENLQTIGDEKTKEYERQIREGFESAPVTEQENKRFNETFLPTEEAELVSMSDSLYDDNGKHHEYDPPWTSFLELDDVAESHIPDYAKGPEPEDTSDSCWDNWHEDPIYIEFDEPLPERRIPRPTPPVPLPQREPNKCKIL